MSSANFHVWSHRPVNNLGFWNIFYFYFLWFSSWCRHKNGFEVFTNSNDINNENCPTCIFITHPIVSFYHTLSQILFMQQKFMYLCLCNGSNEIRYCIIFLSPCVVRFNNLLSIHLFRIAMPTMPRMYWQSHKKYRTHCLADIKSRKSVWWNNVLSL